MQVGALKRRYIVRKGPVTGWIIYDTLTRQTIGQIHKTREQARKAALMFNEMTTRESAVA